VDSTFLNRLRKNVAHRDKWAARQRLTAYRVYDQDIPDYRFSVDRYADHALVVEYRRRGTGDEQRAAVLAAVQDVMAVTPENIHTRTREPKPWGQTQYEKLDNTGARLEVQEGDARLLCNLTDYLDTGLFLDHRTTRLRVGKEARGQRVLNLFCYTGAFTVHAALGGALTTTSVDLSNTYLDWARDNLRLNALPDAHHEFIRSDVTRWLRQARGKVWDLIILDPPSFSASKKMEGTLDIQRDHGVLVEDALALLAKDGVLYFSTNFTGLQPDVRRLSGPGVQELTPASIPEDIRNRQVHRCWRIVRT